jgi:ABC-type transport system involved in Fe-S cluster assembly fused permease/ATPase subunit
MSDCFTLVLGFLHFGGKKELLSLISQTQNGRCGCVRLSTVRAANRIVVMKNGQIAEMGSHEELLRKDGEYAHLTRRQQTTLTQ